MYLFYLAGKNVDEIKKIFNLHTKPHRSPHELFFNNKLVIRVSEVRNYFQCYDEAWKRKIEAAGFKPFDFHKKS